MIVVGGVCGGVAVDAEPAPVLAPNSLSLHFPEFRVEHGHGEISGDGLQTAVEVEVLDNDGAVRSAFQGPEPLRMSARAV